MSSMRRGFSLVELMVVLAVMAIVAGMLLPAVQRVRESANQASCGNNLRQIGLAYHLYEQTNKAFPTNRTPCGPTWAVSIAPYMDRDDVFKEWDFGATFTAQPPEARETPITSYFCPSRRDSKTAPGLSINGDEEVGKEGLGNQKRGALGDYAANLGCMEKIERLDDSFLVAPDNRVRVPRLIGTTRQSAEATLIQRSLLMANSNAAPGCWVSEQWPEPGTVIQKGSSVNLTFIAKVPALEDLRFDNARKRLEAAGLRLASPAIGDTTFGVVIGYGPSEGTVLPMETPVDANFQIRVPELRRKNFKQAKKILEDTALKLRANGDPVEILTLRARVPKCDGQSPKPGTIVKRETIVTAKFVIPPHETSEGGGLGTPGRRPKLRNGHSSALKKNAKDCGDQDVSAGPPYDRLAILTASIKDGMSNFVLVGEKHVPLGKFGRGGWDSALYNGESFTSSGRVAGPGYALAHNLRDKEWKFGSYHPGVCQFLFADGSVHTLASGTDPVLLGRLANFDDGYPLPDLK